jgi:hypothetical protein
MRTSFVRVIPPPIQLEDWDAVEAKVRERDEDEEGQKALFE